MFSPWKVRCLRSFRDGLYVGTDADGVLSSRDDGETWIGVSTGLPSGGQVFALAEVEGVLFAALYNRGLYALGAKDRSWSRIRGVQPLVLANAGGTLIVGHNPGGLYWSRDLGITWSKGIATVDTPSLLGATLAGDSGELSAEAPVWEIGSNGSLVFAGASGHWR